MRFLSRGRGIFRTETLKMLLFFQMQLTQKKVLTSPLPLLLSPKTSFFLYGVFLEPLSSPHPSWGKSGIKSWCVFSFTASFSPRPSHLRAELPVWDRGGPAVVHRREGNSIKKTGCDYSAGRIRSESNHKERCWVTAGCCPLILSFGGYVFF